MQDLKNLNKKKQPNFEFSGSEKKRVLQLDVYYKQGKRWYKLNKKGK